MKILIVDDKKENIYLLETLLKGSGYKVVSAVNGAEALEKLRAEPKRFDMIISDVLMPVMDGFRFCNECKRDDKLKDIPFVFCTATYLDEKDEALGLKLGAKYIRKPIEPDEFIKIIRGLFRDAMKGKIRRKKPALPEEKEMFKLHSERVVKKLEEKVLELEKSEREKSKVLRDLGERVKELNCLNEIAKIVEIPNISLEEIFQKTADVMPPAWQYPDITCARIIVGGQEFKTTNFKETKWKQSADIKVGGKKVDVAEVYYLEEKPEIDEGPFLKEERNLIEMITDRLGRLTERKNAEKAMRDFIYKVNDISPGECYLHTSHDAAYRIFSQLALHGVPGLCISREKPEKLLEYGVPKEKVILLSSTPIKGFKATEDLQEIGRIISNFLKEYKTPIVLLDGLAYLVSRFDFKPVYQFIQEKRFKFIETKATLLMPIDLATFTEKERALLTSEVKLLG